MFASVYKGRRRMRSTSSSSRMLLIRRSLLFFCVGLHSFCCGIEEQQHVHHLHPDDGNTLDTTTSTLQPQSSSSLPLRLPPLLLLKDDDDNGDLNDDDDDDLNEMCQNHTSSRYDPLTCWLWQSLQIVIPDQQFTEYYMTLTLTDLTCRRFVVRAANASSSSSVSSSDAPSSSSLPFLDLTVYNVSITCTGAYHITTGLAGTLTAQVETTSSASPLSWTAQIQQQSSDSTSSDDSTTNHDASSSSTTSSSFLHPTGVTTTRCDTSALSVNTLSFAGSISSKLINLFSSEIKSYVSQALSNQLCPLLIQYVDPMLSSYLQELYKFLQPYLLFVKNDHDEDSSERDHHDAEANNVHVMASRQNSYINDKNNNNNLYAQAPFLVQTLSTLNAFVDTYLQEGLLKRWLSKPSSSSSSSFLSSSSSSESCGSFFNGFNGVIRSLLLGHGADNDDKERDDYFSLPIPPLLHDLHFYIPQVGNISVDIDEIFLQGNALYSWNNLSVLRPDHVTQTSFRTVLQTINETIHNEMDNGDDIVLTIRPHVNLVISAVKEFQNGVDLQESFYLHINLTHLHVAADLGMDLNLQHWPNVTIATLVQIVQDLLDGPTGSSADTSSSLSCLIQAIDSITATNLLAQLQVRDLALSPDDKQQQANKRRRRRHARAKMTSSSSPKRQRQLEQAALGKVKLEEDLDQIVNQVLRLFLREYQPFWTRAIAGLTRGPVQDGINKFFVRMLKVNETDNDKCSNINSTTTTPKYVNFTNIVPLVQFQEFLNQSSTLRNMNEYAQCASNFMTSVWNKQRSSSSSTIRNDNGGASATLSRQWSEALLLLPKPLRTILGDSSNNNEDEDDDYGLVVKIESLEMRNVGSVREMQLVSPTDDGMHLTNGLEFGTMSTSPNTSSAWPLQQTDSGNNNNNNNTLRPELFMGIHLEYPALNVIAAQVNVSILVDEFYLRSGSILQYDINHLQQFPLGKVLTHGQCTLVPVHALQLLNVLQGDLGVFGIVVNASIQMWSSDNNNNITNDTIVIAMDSEKWPAVQELASSILAWTLNSTRDIVNVATLATLERASDLCAGRRPTSANHEDEEPDSSEDYTTIFFIVTAMILLAQPAILALGRQPHEFPIENPYYHDQADENRLLESLLPPDPGMTGIPPTRTRDTKESSSSLLPCLMHSRHVPEMMRVFVPMLILGSIALLLSSNLSIGASVKLKASVGGQNIELPSLFSFSLVNTAREMWQAGIYPLLFLVAIFSGLWPYLKLCLLLTSWVSPPNRLADVETRGRLLLALDALGKFSLVDTYVLVLFVVAFRYHLALSRQSVVDVYVVPQFGFYGFLLATSASLVAGHLLVFYHRRAEMNRLDQTDSSNRPAESLLQHSYQISGGRLCLSRKFKLCLLILLASVVTLLSIGVTRRSFIFEFGGLAGMVLGEDRRSTYSLVSLGTSLGQSVENSKDVGIILLQTLYFFYAVIAPFACLLFLLSLLIIPMKLEQQLIVLTLAEISNAWSAVEVFCLSIVAALLQISTFASFIIGNRCDLVNEILKDYFDDNDDENHNDAMTCFTVNSAVAWDAGFLVSGVLLNSLLVSLVLRMAHSAVGERIRREDDDQHTMDRLILRQDRMSAFEFCVLAGRRFTAWMVVWAEEDERDSPREREAAPPLPPREIERGESFGFSRVWKDGAERDRALKDWKEATNSAT